MGLNRLVIHIGSDKAGSTAIQECLNANLSWYSNHGIHIPRTGFMRMAGHPTLFTNLDSPSLRRDLANEIRGLENADTAILSWEGVHFFDSERRAELRSLIEICAPGCELTFVYYVRDQLSLIQSGLLQQVKQLALQPSTIAALSKPFHEIPPHLVGLLLNTKRAFHRRISDWKQDFPDAHFAVRLYDRAQLVNSDIIDDFHEALGIELDADFRRPTGLANLSLTAESAMVLNEYFQHTWTEDDRRRIVDSALSFRSGTSKYLHETSLRAVREYFASDNRHLAAAYPGCASMDTSDVKANEGISDEIIRDCRAFLIEQSEYPTIMGGSLTGPALGHLNLTEGWTQPNMQGVWAVGTTSTMQFRPRSAHFGGLSPGVSVNLSGKYPGRRATTDELIINGEPFNEVDIFSSEIFIPVDLLDSSYRIRIDFHHRNKRSDPADPSRMFRLTGLDYSVLAASEEIERPGNSA
jgi:hypothetical protein